MKILYLIVSGVDEDFTFHCAADTKEAAQEIAAKMRKVEGNRENYDVIEIPCYESHEEIQPTIWYRVAIDENGQEDPNYRLSQVQWPWDLTWPWGSDPPEREGERVDVRCASNQNEDTGVCWPAFYLITAYSTRGFTTALKAAHDRFAMERTRGPMMTESTPE